MRLSIAYKGSRAAFSCGKHSRYGKDVCSSHRIIRDVIENIVLEDIRSMITLTINEPEARKKFLERKTGLHNSQTAYDNKRRTDITNRITELDGLLQSIYEDKVIGKIPEDVCIGLLEKYQAEKKKLQSELDEILIRLETENQDERDVDEFITRLKKYAGVETLTREMALELIEYITVDECVPRSTEPRTIHIYYKLLDKGLKDKRNALM